MRISRKIQGIAVAVVAGLGFSLLQTAPPPIGDSARADGPALRPDKSIPVTKVVPKPRARRDGTAKAALRTPPKMTWPKAGQAVVTMPAQAGVREAGKPVQAGTLPVWVASAGKQSPDSVRVELADRTRATRAATEGGLLRLSPGTNGGSGQVRVSLDYSGYARAYGGDWSRRLRLVALPECAWTSPGKPECSRATAIRSARNDTAGQKLTAAVDLAGRPMVLGALAGASSDTGDFSATALSASATWSAGGSSGDFSWSYPFRTPPGVGGPEPNLALSYSSQSVDGMVASTNNQPSQAGQGFELGTSYVERKYASCVDDGHTDKGDLCWKSDNATLVLDGRATELVKDADSGVWRLKDDDGSRMQRLTNPNANGDSDREYWKLTTTDGTQYFFGMHVLPGWASGKPGTSSVFYVPVAGDDPDEPCYNSAGFASSFCNQAWKWNLDYVVDPNDNAMSLWYARETNYYAKNGDTTAGVGVYVRGGSLARIEYGQRADTIYSTSAPAKVVFTPELRCIKDSAGACPTGQSAWPDVPTDQICLATQACTGKTAPTFFSRNRLATVTTQVYKSGAYATVDSWTLTHTFPAPGDGTSAALWLANIVHTGGSGTGAITLPAVTFGGGQYTNRVDAIEGNAPMMKWRVHEITSETGGSLDLTYRDTECTRSALPAPDTNTKACFPSYWTRPGEFDPRIDWFHKYLVASVSQVDDVAASSRVTTTYSYNGGGAWRYNTDELTPAKYRTWSDWRGYATVTTTTGDVNVGPRSQSTALYFRGMDGNRTASGGTRPASVTDSEGGVVTDSDHFAGFVRETRVFNGVGGAEVNGEIALPWAVQSASGGGKTAWMVNTRSNKTRTTLDGGREPRRTTLINEYTADGLLDYADDRGDDATTADDRCTRTTYAQNRTDWMLAYPSRVETVSAACTATPTRPDDVLTDVRTAYDNGAVSAAPTRGNPTTEQRLASYNGATPAYQTVSTSVYDAHGRATAVTNADNKTTRTAFTPTTGGPVTKTVVTNPLGHTLTTEIDPAWGVPTKQTDTNNKLTELDYDALGRITSVWLPTRVRANSENPNLKFSYRVSKTTASAVSTSTIRDDGDTYNTTWEIYDGWLRPRQTQKPAPGGGRVVNETQYDARGLASKTRADFYNSSAPSYGLVTTTDAATPAITAYTYDGAGRQTTAAFSTAPASGDIRVDRWQTTTTYGGDRTYVDPPDGGPGVTEITDARGNVIERREHPSGAPTGTNTATKYSYDAADRLRKITDADTNEWTYTFDLRGRQTESVDPDAGHVTQTFDDLDRLATSTDARGRTLAYGYDGLGRKTGLFQGSLTGTKLAEWTYDTVPNAVGQPVASIRYVNGNAYTKKVLDYDKLYRPIKSQVVIPAVEGDLAGDYRTTAAYNIDGSQQLQGLPAAGGLPFELLTFGYNELDMPEEVEGTSTYVTNTVYNKLGDPELYKLQAAPDRYASIAMEYESGTRRLTRSVTSTTVNTQGARHLDRHYTYNDIGDITSVKEDAGAVEIECYKRDGYQRLTDVWTLSGGTCGTPTMGTGPAPYWSSWTYTTTGLRKTQTDHLASGNKTSTYTYPAAGAAQPHAVSSISDDSTTETFGYDASGNTTSRVNRNTGTDQTLTWNDEGQLASIAEGSNTTGNIYDADGQLLLRKDAAETVLFLGQTEAHLSSSGTLSGVRHYSHNGQTIAVRTNDPAGGTGATKLSWLAVDQHNTALVTIDVTTHAASRRRENPYGVLRTKPTDWVSTRSFVGGYGDNTTGTGLVHLGARDYDPATGRFLSVDPVLAPTDPQSLTGYSYGNNNPITASDPTGLRPNDEGAGCGGCSPSRAGSGGRSSSSSNTKPSGGTWHKVEKVVTVAMKAASVIYAITMWAHEVAAANPPKSNWVKDYAAGVWGATLDGAQCIGTGPLCPAVFAGQELAGLPTPSEALAYSVGADTGSGAYFAGIVASFIIPMGPAKASTTAAQGEAKLAAKLASEVDELAARVMAAHANDLHGPVLSGAMDRKTGAIFFGLNGDVPEKLHPLLRRALDAFEGPPAPFHGEPGAHSEVHAVNQGLFARQGSKLEDFLVYSVRLRGSKKGNPIEMCPNCAPILNGAEDLVQ
ncbi:RHS repeat-associated core domain-containing protein [Flindersiella endophytica]